MQQARTVVVMSARAGWYQDPYGDGERYWDGVSWTSQTRPAGKSKRQGGFRRRGRDADTTPTTTSPLDAAPAGADPYANNGDAGWQGQGLGTNERATFDPSPFDPSPSQPAGWGSLAGDDRGTPSTPYRSAGAGEWSNGDGFVQSTERPAPRGRARLVGVALVVVLVAGYAGYTSVSKDAPASSGTVPTTLDPMTNDTALPVTEPIDGLEPVEVDPTTPTPNIGEDETPTTQTDGSAGSGPAADRTPTGTPDTVLPSSSAAAPRLVQTSWNFNGTLFVAWSEPPTLRSNRPTGMRVKVLHKGAVWRSIVTTNNVTSFANAPAGCSVQLSTRTVRGWSQPKTFKCEPKKK